MISKHAFGRVVVYGLLYSTILFLLKKTNLVVSGETAFRLFFYVSALSGIIQTINLAVIKKTEDIGSGVRLKLLRGIQLKYNLRERRRAAFARCIFGVASSLLAAISASVLYIYKECPSPDMVFALAFTASLVSVVLLFLTLFEYNKISDFESELLDAQAADEEAKEAIDELLKEKKE